MKLDLQARGFRMTEGLETAVSREAEAFDRVYGHLVSEANIRLSDINGPAHGGPDKRCTVALKAGRGQTVIASAVDRDLYTAIRSAFEKLRRAIHSLPAVRLRAQRRRIALLPIKA